MDIDKLRQSVLELYGMRDKVQRALDIQLGSLEMLKASLNGQSAKDPHGAKIQDDEN